MGIYFGLVWNHVGLRVMWMFVVHLSEYKQLKCNFNLLLAWRVDRDQFHIRSINTGFSYIQFQNNSYLKNLLWVGRLKDVNNVTPELPLGVGSRWEVKLLSTSHSSSREERFVDSSLVASRVTRGQSGNPLSRERRGTVSITSDPLSLSPLSISSGPSTAHSLDTKVACCSVKTPAR